MKLTSVEQNFVDLLKAAGGTVCPSSEARLTPDTRYVLRRLERKGIITIEQVDTGYRYSLREIAP